MNSAFITFLQENYHWQLSLFAFVAIQAIAFIVGKALLAFPTFREANSMNKAAHQKKMAIPRYEANLAMNKSWGLLFTIIIFGFIMPFCLTTEMKPWWMTAGDIVIILMVYDFFYYLVHRFLFHDGGFLGGPLVWVHAVHHQQHNPCREDSSYIHPLEVAMGLGLYVAVIFVLSRLMGNFHVATFILTWIAFSQINLHNHDLWKADRFPFRYLNYMSVMHHNHHAKFTGGNFATISLLYDWMFGTLDNGEGYKKPRKDEAAA